MTKILVCGAREHVISDLCLHAPVVSPSLPFMPRRGKANFSPTFPLARARLNFFGDESFEFTA